MDHNSNSEPVYYNNNEVYLPDKYTDCSESISLKEVRETLFGSRTGLWRLIAEEGKPLRLIADSTMCDIIGIGIDLPPEEKAAFLMKNIADEDAERFARYLDNLINIGRDEIVYKWNHPTKGLRIMRCGGWRSGTSDGKTIIRGYHQDVTDIQQKHERIETAIKMVNDAYFKICYIDLNTDELFDLKSSAQNDNARPFGDYVRRHISERLPDPVQAAAFTNQLSAENIKAAFDADSGSVLEFTYQRLSDDGLKWAKSIILPVNGYSDKNACAVWYVKNITEQKALEFAADEERRRLNSAQHSIEMRDKVILALGGSYNFSYYIDIEENTYSEIILAEAAHNITGSSGICSKTIGESFLRSVSEESKDKMSVFTDMKTVSDRLSGKKIISCDYLNSAGKWCRISYVPAERNADGKVTKLIFVGQDIDDERKAELSKQQRLADAFEAEKAALKRAEAAKHEAEKLLEENRKLTDELRKACTEAKLANAAKSDFLARMSHDIRTPINGILGLIEMSDRFSGNVEKLSENRAKARVTANHLLSLVNDVLDMSKMESGEINLAEEPFSLNDVLIECREIVFGSGEAKGLSVIMKNTEPLEHPYVIGSPLHLKQILMNIMSNAVKYNRPGGKIIGSADEVEVNDDTVTVRFTIEDTGVGMSEEFQKKMFEPFTQENDTVRSEYNGTGLGMAIIKKLTDKMNGTIVVESKKNVGSKFIVTLPFKRDHEPQSRQNSDCADCDIRGVRLLLAEDNSLNSEIAKFLLEENGAEVDAVTDGRQAYEAVLAHEGYYDAVLMDIMMPVMNGFEASEKIRAAGRYDTSNMPIIAMTANAFMEDVEKCRRSGMNDHIPKPIDITKALKTIAYHICVYRMEKPKQPQL